MSSKPINRVLSEKPWKKYFFQGFFSIFLLWLTLPAFYFPIAAHSDANIRLMLNHFWAYDWQSFEQLIFSQGPLAFLQYPLPIKNNLLWGQMAGLLARGCLLLALLHLCPSTKQHRFLIAGGVFLLVSSFAGHHLIFLVTTLVCTLAALQKKPYWLVVAVFWATLNWHIRLAPGLIGLALIAYAFGVLLSAKPKSRPLWLGAGLAVLFFTASHFLFKSSLAKITELYLGYYHIIFNSPVLVAGQPAPKLFIFIAFAACCLFVFAFRKQLLKSLGLPLFIALALTAFYFTGRPGQGPFLVLLRIMSVCTVLTLFLHPLKKRLVGTLALSVFVLVAMGHTAFNLSYLPHTKPKPLRATQQLLYPQVHHAEWEKQMASWQIPLPPLQCETLIVYPWHFIPFYQSGYALKAVPSLLGYFGHSAYLDSVNSYFLNSLSAGSYLLAHNPELEMTATVDNTSLAFYAMPRQASSTLKAKFELRENLNSVYRLYQKED